MGRRLLLGIPLLAVMASLASAAPAKQGGIFRVGTTGASVQIDPQVSYVTTGWWMEYATAAKLYNYPDKAGQAGGLLRPEVAARVAISRDGRTYTFTIRTGFRFSDGSAVTAKNFAYAIKRVKDPVLNSPGAAFATNIVSATVKAGKLVIHLNHSDPSVLTTLAFPFFQATSTKLPLSQEVEAAYPSAGPYYFARHDVNVLTSLRKNPYWHGNRPRHLDGVDVHWNMNEQDAYQRTLANQLDEGPIPASERQALVDRFGLNKTRLWEEPTQCVSFIVLNNQKGIFAGNAALRKAFNWAIDRTDYVVSSGITPWTHLLSPATPGSVTAKRKQPYSVHSNIAKAQALAAGHFGDGVVKVWYRSSGTVNPAQAQIVRRDLIRMGFDPGKIVMKGLSGAQIYDAIGVKGADYDVGVSMGWCSDYPEDAQFLSGVLAMAHVSDPALERKLAATRRLPVRKRATALGKLDLEIMRTVAPIVPVGYYSSRFFFSDRVDPRSLKYQAVYQDFSIPALSLK
jgi:peptide/nickel transport system substrate-binding protein